MAHGYDLYVVPADPAYRPSAGRAAQLMDFLAERFGLGPTWALDGKEGLPRATVVERLKVQAAARSGRAELRVDLDGERAAEIFGGSPYAEEPEEKFWAEELRIYLTGEPFPYADWEYEDAYCHLCNGPVSGVREALEPLRRTGQPLACGCGSKASPHQLKTTSGVRLAQLALVFAGNEGWLHEVDDDREAFENPEFLKALEEVLGVGIAVLAVSRS